MKKIKLKKVSKSNKVVELSQNDIKKLQREQFEAKRRSAKNEMKNKIKEFKFTKKHVIFIILLIALIAIYYIISNYHRLGLVFNKNITKDDASIVDTMYTDNIVLDYQDKILVFQKGTLTTYNSSGNAVWSKKIEEVYTPSIYTSGKYIQITNSDTGYVYILDGQYEISRIKIEGQILSSKINKDGTSVIEYSTSGLKTVLGIYDKKGKELYALKLSSNTLSDYTLSENSKFLAYSYADISGISLVTKVDIVELARVKEEDYKFETIVAKNNELVYKMYWQGKNLNVLLNDSVIKYNCSSDLVEDYSISDINPIDMDICDNKLSYIYQDSETSDYILKVVDYNMKLKSSIIVSEPPKYYIYTSGLIYVCYQKQIDVYNSHGVKIKNYTSDTVITKPIIYNDGKCIAMYISNRIITFKI